MPAYSRENANRGATSTVLTETKFWTDDLDHAIEHLRDRFVEHSRVPVGKTPFGWGYRSISSANLSVGWVTNRGANVLRTELTGSAALVHFPIGNSTEYRVGRRILDISPDRGVLMPPGYAYTVNDHGGSTLAIVVDSGALIDELERLGSGRRGHLALQATDLRPTKRSRASLQRLLHRVYRFALAAPVAPDQQSMTFVEDEIVSWLATEIIRQNGVEPLSPARRRRVEWIERWIEANLDEPIDLARLSKVTGVGPRALAKTTRAARGLTPMEWVLSRRLEMARRLLARSDERTIARIASDCGFTHLGRFAAAYRAAYGELPSETMARRRRDS